MIVRRTRTFSNVVEQVLDVLEGVMLVEAAQAMSNRCRHIPKIWQRSTVSRSGATCVETYTLFNRGPGSPEFHDVVSKGSHSEAVHHPLDDQF